MTLIVLTSKHLANRVLRCAVSAECGISGMAKVCWPASNPSIPKCSVCVELKERIRQARSKQDQDAQNTAQKAYEEHLATMLADRTLAARLETLSDRSCTCNFPGRILKLAIDGMDQSKFRCPRHVQLSDSKSFQGCWRPTLHLTGVQVHGACEVFYISDEDMCKDANHNITLIMDTLDKVHKQLAKKYLSVPVDIVIMVWVPERQMLKGVHCWCEGMVAFCLSFGIQASWHLWHSDKSIFELCRCAWFHFMSLIQLRQTTRQGRAATLHA